VIDPAFFSAASISWAKAEKFSRSGRNLSSVAQVVTLLRLFYCNEKAHAHQMATLAGVGFLGVIDPSIQPSLQEANRCKGWLLGVLEQPDRG
jgi:hypothetical protein